MDLNETLRKRIKTINTMIKLRVVQTPEPEFIFSGGEIQMNRALGAKFFKFGMVVGMGMVVSKTIANKLWSISGGHLAYNSK